MATTYTPLLELPKHDPTDPFDITKINDMADLVDAAMAKAYRGKAVHNLLDNSDFRNPINQRGVTETGDAGYNIDRWLKGNASGIFAVGDGYVSLTGNGAWWFFRQRVDPKKIISGRSYTVAFCDINGDKVVYATTLTNNMAAVSSPNMTFATAGIAARINIGWENNAYGINLTSNSTTELKLAWAALYEGTYTADTLPEYQPKGYAAELMECMRYYIKILTQPVNGWCYNWGRVTMFVPTPVRMRNANPTATLSSMSPNFYIGSTSYSASLASCSAVNNGVNVIFNHSSAVSGQCIMPEFSAEISADL